MPWPPKPDEWHYAYGVYKSTTDDNLAGHGSCVASKAAGWKTGVSKNSHLVMMKSLPTLADVNFAFAAALDDIIVKRRQRKAVVVYPATSIQTFRVGTALPRNWRSVQEIIHELFTMNVAVVTAAGNNAARSPVLDTVPAMWTLDADFPLIVAGAVKLDGSVSKFSQGAAEMAQVVWAPGENIVCANGPSAPGTVVRSGTSFAAAMVSTTYIPLPRVTLSQSNPIPSKRHLDNGGVSLGCRPCGVPDGRLGPFLPGIHPPPRPLPPHLHQPAHLSPEETARHLERTGRRARCSNRAE